MVTDPVLIPGGLSNDLWRLSTTRGTYAVKRMVVNADHPAFARNIEDAYAIERRAYEAGVPMPAPVPDPVTSTALAHVHGSFVRVHVWVDGMAPHEEHSDVGRLLARVHAAGRPRMTEFDHDPWTGIGWDDHITALSRSIAHNLPQHGLVVDSHRDLDRKNALRLHDGTLIAVDWDAAGTVSAIQEAARTALDWSDMQPAAFRNIVDVYQQAGGVEIPAEPWIFGSWLDGYGGWLDYNAAHRRDTQQGNQQIRETLKRLRHLAGQLGTSLDALP